MGFWGIVRVLNMGILDLGDRGLKNPGVPDLWDLGIQGLSKLGIGKFLDWRIERQENFRSVELGDR